MKHINVKSLASIDTLKKEPKTVMVYSEIKSYIVELSIHDYEKLLEQIYN